MHRRTTGSRTANHPRVGSATLPSWDRTRRRRPDTDLTTWVTTCLAIRTLVTTAVMASLPSTAPAGRIDLLFLLAVVVGHAATAPRTDRLRLLRRRRLRWLLVLDLGAACAIGLLPSFALHGNVPLTTSTLCTGYALLTGAGWGTVLGDRAGVVVALVGCLPPSLTLPAAGCEMVRAWTHHDLRAMSAYGAWSIWLAALLAIGTVGWAMSTLPMAAWRRGVRAGREAERSETDRWLHDTVLQTIEAMALRATSDDRPPEEVLEQIRHAAVDQSAMLRRRFVEGEAGATATPSAEVAQGIQQVVGEARKRGLTVVLDVTAVEGRRLAPESIRALAGAAREALANVAKHAGTDEADVHAVATGHRIEVVVRDRGIGWDPYRAPAGFGITRSIRQRLREVGGDAVVDSEPGEGTRVRLWVPDTAPRP